ncbi:MAG: hypothetical protein IJS54_06965 [Desulfovibrio sp.]|nr:hypothetical protein [Desulfovibrio sp.]
MEKQGLCLLDQALEIAAKEMEAIEQEAFEEAIALSKEREKITLLAWDHYTPTLREQYRQRLTTLLECHKKLIAKATVSHDHVQAAMQQSKLERRRIKGYHQALSHALQ